MFEFIDKLDSLIVIVGVFTIVVFAVFYVLGIIIKGARDAGRKLRKPH